MNANNINANSIDMSIQLDSGFSVYIDYNKFKKIKKNTEEQNGSFGYNNNDNMNIALNDIYPKYIEKWVDSNLVMSCQSCDVKFSLFVGKHHCRACGCVFCRECCYKYMRIPNFIKKPKEDDTYKQQIVNLYKYGRMQDSLVCTDCYSKIKNLEKISFNLNIAEFFDLKTLYATLRVNKKWYNACIHYLSKFRDIQYKNNCCLYESWEINIVDISRNILLNHSNWKIHLIKSDIQNYFLNKKIFFGKYNKNINMNMNMNDAQKNYKYKEMCWSLMCSRKCNLELDLLDYVEILKFVSILNDKKNIIWKDETLRNNLIDILHEICSTSNEINASIIKNIMPLLCSVLISLLNDCIEEINIDFIKKMLDEFLIFPESIFCLYDEVQYLRTLKDKSMGTINLYDILKEYLKKDIHKDEKKIINMIESIKDIVDKKKDIIKLPILYPFDYNWNIVKINDYAIMKSNSAPILFDVVIMNSSKNTKNVKFLIKKESTLRKEQLVSSVIYLLLFRLKQHEAKNNKFYDAIPTYQIKMLSTNIGVIEFVENSITLREISDRGYTIQNYISEHNKNEILDIIKKRFMHSLAISCCISYLLGLGDRHLDNIMINERGQIFNIDYGYLLENPKTNILGAPNIKVTTDMIDFLGGPNSEYYKNFKSYLIYVYDIMRLYKNVIINHYEIIGNEKFLDWEYFKDKLENRFMTGLMAKDIKIVLMSEIESSGTSVANSFNDTCHKLAM
jgi:hypothetical protein